MRAKISRSWRLAGQWPQLVTPQVALIALDYSPFPATTVQKMKSQAQAALQASASAQTAPPDPMAQAEVANLNASTALKAAQTEKTRAQTQGCIPS